MSACGGEDSRLKTIRIKTGVVKRIGKEVQCYKKETDLETARLEKFRNEGKDEYDIRKQEEVLKESQMMVPQTAKRFKDAFEDLESVLKSEADLAEEKVYIEAKTVVDDNRALLSAAE